jgi:thioester reductase-like protein
LVASVGGSFGGDAVVSAKLTMAIFLTGSTGYLGSYLVAGLFTGHAEKLNLLVRAKTEQEARERLWQSL